MMKFKLCKSRLIEEVFPKQNYYINCIIWLSEEKHKFLYKAYGFTAKSGKNTKIDDW